MFERSKGSVRENMQVLQKGGVVKEEDVKGAISRISYTPDITVCNGDERGGEERVGGAEEEAFMFSFMPSSSLCFPFSLLLLILLHRY